LSIGPAGAAANFPVIMQPPRADVPLLARRSLLGLDRRRQAPPQRPPWAVAGALFESICDRCGNCLDACPPHLIAPGAGGYPEISFRAGTCTFCGKCAESCPTGALARGDTRRRPWHRVARIEPGCLAMQRVECRICGENCEARAIGFVLAPGRVAQPDVRVQNCSGCGACVSLCPAEAIRMEQNSEETSV